MNAIVFPQALSARTALADTGLINQITDLLYAKLHDDYRINRFFGSRPLAEQTDALKAYLQSLFGAGNHDNSQLLSLLDDFFTAAFARNNAKPSLVTGNDFMFLLDIVGGDAPRPLAPLCASHNFLLKLLPDDSHYDVVMEHLTATLADLNIAEDVAYPLLALAEKGRDAVLGRGAEIKQAA